MTSNIVWQNRVNNELLQLTGDKAAEYLPQYVQVGERILDIEQGKCHVFVSIEISSESTTVIDLFLNLSSKTTNFPFFPPHIHILDTSKLDLPNASDVIPVSYLGEQTENDGNSMVDLDLHWSPNLTLVAIVHHIALKLRECVLQNEPLMKPAPYADEDDGIQGDDVYQSEIMDLTENFNVGKQKIADYFNKFTKKIDEKLDQIDQQFEKSNDKYYDIDALSKMNMYEAKFIDKDKRKKSSFWSNLMQGNSTNYLGITLDGKFLVYVNREGLLLRDSPYPLENLHKLKFKRGNSVTLYFNQMSSKLCCKFETGEGTTKLVKSLQNALSKLGIEGRHSTKNQQDAAKGIETASNLLDLAKGKIMTFENSEEGGKQEIEKIMSLLRDAAEKFSVIEGTGHADVVKTMHQFLSSEAVKRILDSDIVEKVTASKFDDATVEDKTITNTAQEIESGQKSAHVGDQTSPKNQKMYSSESDIIKEYSSPIPELIELDTRKDGRDISNSKSSGTKDMEVNVVPEGEVLEASPWMLDDDFDFDEGDENNDVVKEAPPVTEAKVSSEIEDVDEEVEEGVISSDLSNFLRDFDEQLDDLMKI